jgi:AraC-like DNA-binding protein
MVLEPTLTQIRQALEEAVVGRRASVDSVARALHCSASTIHRRLNRRGTSFAAERAAIQAGLAFDLITRGCRISTVAGRVGVSSDHLCVIVRKAYGLTPRQLQRITRLARRLGEEPRTRQELAQFERDDALMQSLLAPIDADHPLAGWAKGLVLLGDRPEYYDVEFMRRLKEQEARRRVTAQQIADFQVVAGLSEEECRATPEEMDLLHEEAAHRAETMRWRSRQLRDARKHLRAYSRPARRGPT